ncbi:hypothetical protein [Streptomyces sp. NPDC059850]|uniref:hypothetical protein n=1 Tax=Streptomyces sp. NPDC059850 TaxID=3346970 RepID=UPI00365244E7
MKIRTHRVVRDGDEVYPDGEGTRFFGLPAWRICFVLCAAMPVALLAYTYASR